ncbi:MAG: hypothetical protein DCE90_07905 [Pseudanabaena sp.]|nr:MAG: hypothetical protein DCE90_07905 [Pseudanabaena sp.]
MASLMQKFAEAKQQRLQERADFLAACEQSRQVREQEFQEQAQATAKYLAHAEQNRLAWEQGRQAIAENALVKRHEELQDRAEQVASYLQELNETRVQKAAEDSEERAQEVRNRTFKSRSQLKHIHKARIRNGVSARQQRQQLVKEREILTSMQLEDLQKSRLAEAQVAAEQRSQEASLRATEVASQLQDIASQRIAMAKVDIAARSQEFLDRAAEVQSTLSDIHTQRMAAAEAQAEQLRSFRANLKASVWSGDRAATTVEPVVKPVTKIDNLVTEKKPTKVSKKAIPTVEVKAVEASKAVEVKEKETPKEAVKTSNKIEQFVVDYVSQLSTNSSLLEVVNDRDTVRDLLAQGANTLKVDPSDILNTLLQMAEAS